MREYGVQMKDELVASGRSAVAQMFDGKAVPSFAKWRWGTIFEVCNAISCILETLAGVWGSLKFVQKMRDNSLVKAVTAALTSKDWMTHQFFFVDWFAHWLVKLQRWGMGCTCHRSQLENGESVECHMKGRLLRVAYDHACEYFAAGVQEVIRDSFNGLVINETWM